MRASGRTLVLGELSDLINHTLGLRPDETTPLRVLTQDGEELDVIGAVLGNDRDVLVEIDLPCSPTKLERLIDFVKETAETKGAPGRKALALLQELELD